MSYRRFLNVLLLVVFLGFIGVSGALAQQVALPGNKIPQFVDPLPNLHVTTATDITLNMQEFPSPVMPSTFLPGVYQGTYVWGYKDAAGQSATSYIGPVIVATRGAPTEVKYVNNLGTTTSSQLAFWITSTDQTLHWADPNMQMGSLSNYAGPIPAVPHLHGGEVPPVLDGGPDAWFLSSTTASPAYDQHGHAYYTKNATDPINGAVYRYPNSQEAANIWFHDHALGITRLNVYAGLAGAYIIKASSPNLPPDDLNDPTKIIPLVIQDRMFDVNGQLFFPNIGINPTIHPFWIPEFVGDTIVVNGKVWPFLEVGYDRYRFLFLNGSNARFYDMSLIDPVSGVRGPRMWVIGTDGGYLDKPILIDPNTTIKAVSKSLVFGPGERYDVIIDFNDPLWLALINAAYPGGVPNPLNLILRNTAKTPFPNGAPAKASTTGRVMQVRVMAAPTSGVTPVTYNPAAATGSNPLRLNNPIQRLSGVMPQVTRQLTLNEVMGLGGPLEVLVNNTKWSGLSVATDKFTNGIRPDFSPIPIGANETYYSELPQEGQTELWEIINLTADAHPIHLHLVQFQLLNRQPFDVKGYNAAYNGLFPGSNAIDPMTGAAFPPGVFIGGFGPPAHYNTGVPFNGTTTPVTTFKGGNPDVTGFLNQKKWPTVAPLPHEVGWKDTVIMYPGEVTRIMVRWAPTDLPASTPSTNASAVFPFDPNALYHGYVWHCHIIDHEDNEMMRPTSVTPNPAFIGTRDYLIGTHY